MVIFRFNKDSVISNWQIVDDVVMGGQSSGMFSLSDTGTGVFSGTISLKNNGGFSMVRYRFPTEKISNYSKASIRLKGDGKHYQFRIKSNSNDKHAYIAEFIASEGWNTIEILFKNMYPAFRGKKLDMSNYSGNYMEEIAFLIGNKKAELFNLEIESIILK